MALDIDGIVDQLKDANALELADLVSAIEDEFGVSAAAPVAAAGTGGGEDNQQEEKTNYDVELTEIGDAKIKVIKAVREATGLGLKDAKDLVDNAPGVIKEDMPKEDAEALVSAIEDAGGKAELK